MKNKITASVVLYNNSLKECHSFLDCLLASPVEKIYLVDHSGNDSLSVLKKYSPKTEYIHHENLGYGAGHNIAIRNAVEINPDGYHIIMNADVSFSPETIKKLSAFMDHHLDAGLCMPDIYDPNGNRQYLCKYLPTPIDLIGKRFLPQRIMHSRLSRLQMMDEDYTKILSVPWLSGCFMFLRMQALQRVNGFDERFFLYGEDIDLSRRLHERFATLYCPETKVIHAHAAASYHSRKMTLIHIINVSRYFNKWGWFFDPQRNTINTAAAVYNSRKNEKNPC